MVFQPYGVLFLCRSTNYARKITLFEQKTVSHSKNENSRWFVTVKVLTDVVSNNRIIFIIINYYNYINEIGIVLAGTYILTKFIGP